MELSNVDIEEMNTFTKWLRTNIYQIRHDSKESDNGGLGELIHKVNGYGDVDSDFVNRFKDETLNDAMTIYHSQVREHDLKKDTLSFMSAEEAMLSSLTTNKGKQKNS